MCSWNAGLAECEVQADVPPLHAQEQYEEGYGTVLDSGTTFTYLPTDAFQSFKEAVTAFALEHGLRSVKGPDPKVSMCRPPHCLQGSTQVVNIRGLPCKSPLWRS